MRPISTQEVFYILLIVTLAYFAGYHVGKKTAIEDAAEELRRKNESGKN